MKMKLLFIASFVFTALTLNAQKVNFTNSLTTAEVGSTIVVDYTYTSLNTGDNVYCTITLQGVGSDSWKQVSEVVGSWKVLETLGSGSGTFKLAIPKKTKLTADLVAPQNYKIKVQLQTDKGVWLAGDYPATEIKLSASN
jgi:hypothetical protein